VLAGASLGVGCYQPAAQLCLDDCSFDGGSDVSDGAPEGICAGTAPNEICYAVGSVPTNTITLSSFDTVSTCPGTRHKLDGQMICLIVADTVKVTASIAITGADPVMIVGFTTVTIDASINLSGDLTRPAGSAPPHPQCVPPTNPISDNAGAAGGSFASLGGNGGRGIEIGGIASAATNLLTFRGGCDGGNGFGALSGGGLGGGAIYLASATKIRISALINAGGGGGVGGPRAKGGAGGGSGGYIAIDAPTLEIDGGLVVLATGGGGGGGGSVNSVGFPGTTPSAASSVGLGGLGGLGAVSDLEGAGGNGNGAAAAGDNGNPPSANDQGAGGGGGGRGTIQLFKGGACARSQCQPTPVINL